MSKKTPAALVMLNFPASMPQRVRAYLWVEAHEFTEFSRQFFPEIRQIEALKAEWLRRKRPPACITWMLEMAEKEGWLPPLKSFSSQHAPSVMLQMKSFQQSLIAGSIEDFFEFWLYLAPKTTEEWDAFHFLRRWLEHQGVLAPYVPKAEVKRASA